MPVPLYIPTETRCYMHIYPVHDMRCLCSHMETHARKLFCLLVCVYTLIDLSPCLSLSLINIRICRYIYIYIRIHIYICGIYAYIYIYENIRVYIGL